MSRTARDAFGRWQRVSQAALQRIEVVALFPILVLAAYAVGRTEWVLAAALVLPSLLVLQNVGQTASRIRWAPPAKFAVPYRPANKSTMVALLNRISAMPGFESACFVLKVHNWEKVVQRVGAETARDVNDECFARLRAALRTDDLVAELGPASFGVVLHPIPAAR